MKTHLFACSSCLGSPTVGNDGEQARAAGGQGSSDGGRQRDVVSGDSSDPNRPSTSSSSSAPGDAEGDAGSGPGGTYPNPTNFAERVMHILENNIAPSAIWWVDGQSIALHPEAARSTGLLATHFHANRFSTFVRTFVRW